MPDLLRALFAGDFSLYERQAALVALVIVLISIGTRRLGNSPQKRPDPDPLSDTEFDPNGAPKR